MQYSVLLNHYRGVEKTSETILWQDGTHSSELAHVAHQCDPSQLGKIKTTFTVLINQSIPNSGVCLRLETQCAQELPYVFMPAALYDGNRFRCAVKPYPPMLTAEEARASQGEIVISDVPRLNQSGISTTQLNTGDLATPCVGYFSKTKNMGYLLFFPQGNALGNFGITYSEKEAGKISFSLASPCLREKHKYAMCTTDEPSDDRAAQLCEGMCLTFQLTEYNFSCKSITEFYEFFYTVRNENGLARSLPNVLPWSYGFSLIEEKYNKRNWLETEGFYKSSEATASIYRQWQTGWVGGAMNTLPCFVFGNQLSKERSRRTLDFVFSTLQHSSGFLYGIYCDATAYGDDSLHPENPYIVMSRKNADALYYLAKQLLYLEKNAQIIEPVWQKGLKKLADAFCSFYHKNSEVGQFINIETQTLYVAGSSSAGIVSAGLTLCSTYFKKESYLTDAKKLAELYYHNYVAKGISNGGPGEILASPDSESAFGLLESYIALYSETKKEKWLTYATHTAALCASWCVSYDYEYEKETQFYQRAIATTGAVWANVQNKHASPGICTLSGSSLFRLYRATGDKKHLALCRDIAHNLTQYLGTPIYPMRASYVWHNKEARKEKCIAARTANAVFRLYRKRAFKKIVAPIYHQLFNPSGRINERANLSDWEGKNNVGEVPLGSCWCEVSAMLTYLEIPSVYIQKDTQFVYPIDHVTCKIVEKIEGYLRIALTNPTVYDATYRLFVENSTDCSKPIDDMCLQPFITVAVKASETTQIEIMRG